jgi:hypothetical protein
MVARSLCSLHPIIDLNMTYAHDITAISEPPGYPLGTLATERRHQVGRLRRLMRLIGQDLQALDLGRVDEQIGSLLDQGHGNLTRQMSIPGVLVGKSIEDCKGIVVEANRVPGGRTPPPPLCPP